MYRIGGVASGWWSASCDGHTMMSVVSSVESAGPLSVLRLAVMKDIEGSPSVSEQGTFSLIRDFPVRRPRYRGRAR